MPFLDWVNKNQARASSTQVPYHLLQKEAEYGAPSENMVIQGDNLLALRALMPLYSGRVKCIYIDPPYNTQSAFEHYDDRLEHSQWLSMMYPRLVLLRDLLAEDGSIWISIDDKEMAYLKVLMDEVFGRKNFITSIAWQQRTTRENRKVFSSNHEYILLYAKNPTIFSMVRNDLHLTNDVKERYKNPDNDPRGPWQSVSANAQAGHATPSQFYSLVSPSGKIHTPPDGRCWLYTEDVMKRAIQDNRIWFGKNGSGVPRVKKFLNEAKMGLTPDTLWLAQDVGTNDFAKKHVISIFNGINRDIFDTPKPESLIERIVHIATNKNDLVLDSFLGSGTTAAVAHKMGRRYIGIEMGEHAKTHCIPRLQKVIEGEQGGISQSVEWQGGGGFGFYTLHPEPVFQANGQIRPDIKFEPLAAYIWHMETGVGSSQSMDSPLLGVHNGIAYYLLYNGILGDRRSQGGNVLTRPILAWLQAEYPHDGPKVIYGESIRIGEERLAQANVTFKQIPYDVVLR
ncbi:site-specific DNA-methyltransferase [Aeromonas sp.]|uniref:site-specific DNA-methyltransferase n=1 Tax=Aeromonas sp. TaxID=647 RepID=UPI00258E2C7E|nr:site-specific DNA-methyltransferase [Aeromonas sp.]MCX7132104.1 site-specific DNA-methyltransferase [Aeromonas sp.]